MSFGTPVLFHVKQSDGAAWRLVSAESVVGAADGGTTHSSTGFSTLTIACTTKILIRDHPSPYSSDKYPHATHMCN